MFLDRSFYIGYWGLIKVCQIDIVGLIFTSRPCCYTFLVNNNQQFPKKVERCESMKAIIHSLNYSVECGYITCTFNGHYCWVNQQHFMLQFTLIDKAFHNLKYKYVFL